MSIDPHPLFYWGGTHHLRTPKTRAHGIRYTHSQARVLNFEISKFFDTIRSVVTLKAAKTKMDNNPSDYSRSRALVAYAKEQKRAGNLQFHTRDLMLFALCLHVTGEAKTWREAAVLAGVQENSIYAVRCRPAYKKLEDCLTSTFENGEELRVVSRLFKLSQQNENLNVAMRASVELLKISGMYPDQSASLGDGSSGSGAVKVVSLREQQISG